MDKWTHLASEIKALGQTLVEAMHEAHQYRCTCGEGVRGEISCRYCNRSTRAQGHFNRAVEELIAQFREEVA